MVKPSPLVARPTTYRGINMRSRLEATYAAWLDGLSFDWEYEPRAYAGHGGQYLPDFVLHNVGLVGILADAFGQSVDVFVEVKPLEVFYTAKPRPEDRMAIIWESIPDAILLFQFDGTSGTRWHPGAWIIVPTGLRKVEWVANTNGPPSLAKPIINAFEQPR